MLKLVDIGLIKCNIGTDADAHAGVADEESGGGGGGGSASLLQVSLARVKRLSNVGEGRGGRGVRKMGEGTREKRLTSVRGKRKRS